MVAALHFILSSTYASFSTQMFRFSKLWHIITAMSALTAEYLEEQSIMLLLSFFHALIHFQCPSPSPLSTRLLFVGKHVSMGEVH